MANGGLVHQESVTYNVVTQFEVYALTRTCCRVSLLYYDFLDDFISVSHAPPIWLLSHNIGKTNMGEVRVRSNCTFDIPAPALLCNYSVSIA